MRRTAAILLVFALRVGAEEAFTPALESGDTWVVHTEAALELRLSVVPVEGGRDGTPIVRTVRSTLALERTVDWLEVPRTGGPEAWRVLFVRARSSEGAGTPETAAGWEGRSWEVRGVETVPADPPADVAPLLRDFLDWRTLLPPRPAAAGATWDIPPAAVARLVVRGAAEEPAPEAPLAARFAEVREGEESRVAVVAVTGTLRTDSRQDFRVVWEVAGEFHYDLTFQRPVLFTLSGTATALEGRLEDRNGLLSGKVDARGSTFSTRIRWVAK